MRYVYFISVLIIAISCRKDKCQQTVHYIYSHDTILPHPYYPAFPGSYWVYNDSLTVTVDPDYKLFTLIENNTIKSCNSLIKEEVYLPQIGDQYLHYDKLLKNLNQYHHEEYLIFSEDTSWNSWQDPASLYNTSKNYYDYAYYKDRKLISHLDTLTVGTEIFHDILAIEERSFVSAFNGVTTDIDTIYYAKNVGIIRQLKMHRDNYPPFEIDTFDLTDYFINQ